MRKFRNSDINWCGVRIVTCSYERTNKFKMQNQIEKKMERERFVGFVVVVVVTLNACVFIEYSQFRASRIGRYVRMGLTLSETSHLVNLRRGNVLPFSDCHSKSTLRNSEYWVTFCADVRQRRYLPFSGVFSLMAVFSIFPSVGMNRLLCTAQCTFARTH